MEKSRTANSIRNSIVGIFAQLSIILLNFISRKIFIICLNVEYLGLNGLFSNILSILSLAELGVGGAIVYSMYEPLSANDQNKLKGLMNLYARLYRIIGIVIGCVGVCLVPVLPYLIKEQPSVNHLEIIYLLFLINTVVSYFFAYKRSIISADQKEYLISKYRVIFNLIKSVFQIIGIIFFRNFFVYLVIQIIFTIFENVFISVKANKLYPFLRTNTKVRLEKDETKKIFNNTGALMIYKIANVFLGGIDNLIVSSMLGVFMVALYSNYTLVIGSIQGILTIITGALEASVGNFMATEEDKRKEELLDALVFMHYFLYGFSSVCLFTLMNPFIELLFGSEFVLPLYTTGIIVMSFYVWGLMAPFWTFRTTMGLFVQGKWRPVISGILNLVLSIVLATELKLFGIILATVLSRMLTNWWFDPYIIYAKGLKKSPICFYIKWIKYALVIIVQVCITMAISYLLGEINFAKFILLTLITIVVSISVFLLMFGKSREFQFLLNRCFILFGDKLDLSVLKRLSK